VKVHRTAENGREIVLYHIREGESCILSALGIVNRTPFPAFAEVERKSEILLVPATTLENLIDRYPAWRRYIYAIYNDRFNTLLELVDEMLFRRIDIRLSRFLLEHADESGCILNLTHQQLALELGSSREVVSRVLKSLQVRGLVEYGRNRIEIIDRSALEKLADM
jgi:CRP/FNR family transcriptional regulator